MRILLTGATGFAGRAFLEAVRGRAAVTALGRSAPQQTGDGVAFVPVDLTDAAEVTRAATFVDGRFDVLVHLAAYVPRTGAQDDLRAASAVNIDGTLNLLDAFGDRVDRHVMGSTVEVYDRSLISAPIDRRAHVGPVSAYAATKLASEHLAMSFSAKHGLPTTVLRFSVMYGPDDPLSRAIPNFVRAAVRGSPIEVGGSRALRDYVHVRDVAESVILAAGSTAVGVVDIGTGTGVSIEDAARAIVAAAGSTSVVLPDGVPGTDIIVDAAEAEDAIGFAARMRFPDGLAEIIEAERIARAR